MVFYRQVHHGDEVGAVAGVAFPYAYSRLLAAFRLGGSLVVRVHLGLQLGQQVAALFRGSTVAGKLGLGHGEGVFLSRLLGGLSYRLRQGLLGGLRLRSSCGFCFCLQTGGLGGLGLELGFRLASAALGGGFGLFGGLGLLGGLDLQVQVFEE